MSSTPSNSPTSPLDHRDIRSAAQGFKRDKDHSSKWSNGRRPLHGISAGSLNGEDKFDGGDEITGERFRPSKQPSQMGRFTDNKSHANKNPKPFGSYAQGAATSRLAHKSDAIVQSKDDGNSTLSKSLLELLPTHVNNTTSPVQTALRSTDAEILYSFDNQGPSPGEKGRNVDLSGLVEKAEKKWVAEQTEKMVRGEYEVLNDAGETVGLTKSGKAKRSPKQRATMNRSTLYLQADGDEEFELV